MLQFHMESCQPFERFKFELSRVSYHGHSGLSVWGANLCTPFHYNDARGYQRFSKAETLGILEISI